MKPSFITISSSGDKKKREQKRDFSDGSRNDVNWTGGVQRMTSVYIA